MLLVARHKIVRSGSIGTFQKYIVIGVACHFKVPVRSHGIAVVLDKLEQLLAKALANPEFRPGKYLTVFLQDGTGDIQAGRFGNGEQQNRALQPGWLDGGGNQYIGVDYQTEGKHYRFGF